ncbi:MAG: recombinase family protein [bacterium]
MDERSNLSERTWVNFAERHRFDFDLDPEESRIVERVFMLYSQGIGYARIKKLTGCPLSIWGIAKLLENPFYAGKVKFGGIVETNNHQAIVSEKLFKKCQKVRESKGLKV